MIMKDLYHDIKKIIFFFSGNPEQVIIYDLINLARSPDYQYMGHLTPQALAFTLIESK